jgi:hypothetical protein
VQSLEALGVSEVQLIKPVQWSTSIAVL